MSLGPMLARLAYAIRRFSAQRVSGVQLGRDCRLGPGVKFRRLRGANSRGQIAVGDGSDFRDGVIVETWGGRIGIGRHVFIGPQAVIYGHGGVEIGDHTLISMHCCILSSNHTIPPKGISIRSQPDVLLPTKIGRDVWLGAGVKVMGGVTIGDGCVVGAGAVVTSDLPPGSVAHGVPARVVRQREE